MFCEKFSSSITYIYMSFENEMKIPKRKNNKNILQNEKRKANVKHG